MKSILLLAMVFIPFELFAANLLYFANNKKPVVCVKVEFLRQGESNFCLKQGEKHSMNINTDAYACFCYINKNEPVAPCDSDLKTSLRINVGQSYRFGEDSFPTNCTRK